MSKTGKNARGEKRMTKAGAASKPADAPLLGEAALNEALAEIKAAPSASTAAHANGNTATGAAAPAPKTVSQVLGEITWLMTQSPRHKAIELGVPVLDEDGFRRLLEDGPDVDEEVSE